MQITNSSYSYYKSMLTSQALPEHSKANHAGTKINGKNDQVTISEEAQMQAKIGQFLAEKPMTKLYYSELSEKDGEKAEAFISDMINSYEGSEFEKFDSFCITSGISNTDELKSQLDNTLAMKKAFSIALALNRSSEFDEAAQYDYEEYGYMTGSSLTGSVFSIQGKTGEWEYMLNRLGSDWSSFYSGLKEAENNNELISYTESFINSLSDEQEQTLKDNNFLAHPTYAGMGIEGIGKFTKAYEEIPGYAKVDDPLKFSEQRRASNVLSKLERLSGSIKSVLYSAECTIPIMFDEGLYLRDDKNNIVLQQGKFYHPDNRLTDEEIQESLKNWLGEDVYDHVTESVANELHSEYQPIKDLLNESGLISFFDGTDPSALYEKFPPANPTYSTAVPEGETTVIADENTVLVFPPEIFVLPEASEEEAAEPIHSGITADKTAGTDIAPGKDFQDTKSIDTPNTNELSLGESFLKYIRQKAGETSLSEKPQETVRNELLSEAKKFWFDMMKNPEEKEV